MMLAAQVPMLEARAGQALLSGVLEPTAAEPDTVRTTEAAVACGASGKVDRRSAPPSRGFVCGRKDPHNSPLTIKNDVPFDATAYSAGTCLGDSRPR